MIEVYSVESELKTVETEMNKEMQFNSSTLDDLLNLPMNNLDRYMSPALVLSVSCMTGKISKTILSLATVFQYVFLAHHIHKLITDEDMSEHSRQFPVLTGDFMFGQTLKKVCQEDIFPYAGQFVKLIKTINEGILMRWRYKNKRIPFQEYNMILGNERASLTALAVKLSAKLSGIPQTYIDKLENFGYCIGMAWAASEEPACASILQENLSKAEENLAQIRDYLPIKPLQELMEFLSAEIERNKKAGTGVLQQ
ncbi:hypothetical protein [Dehalobacter restrictus]|uniref:hypothetical protein n=1 Tax=Dehalobacter restrictus TaxID=55583 RepID=UPI00338F8BC3